MVSQLADYLAQTQPGLRGFTHPNLFRMRQFYEAYRDDEKVSAMLRQLPWTHSLIMLSQSKRPEEREFYLRTKAPSSPDQSSGPNQNSRIFLANGNHPPIILGNKTRQGYVRKHILKLAGYFFPRGR